MSAAAGAGPQQQQPPPEVLEKFEEFQRLEVEVRTLVSRHQQFETQFTEYNMVKEVRFKSYREKGV
jgi:hypothetical protein